MIYCVLAMPRTGSHLLQTGINQHPQVEGYLELLNGGRGQEVGGKTVQDFDKPEEYTQYLVDYESQSDCHLGLIVHVQAMMYRPQLMRFLNDNLDLVVSLTRENLLRRVVSFKKAQNTRKWQLWKEAGEEARKTATVAITEQDLRYGRDTQRYHDRMPSVIDKPEYVSLSYEELVEDYQGLLTEIWTALGLEPVQAEKKLVKQTPEPLTEVVDNYDEFAKMARERGLKQYLNE